MMMESIGPETTRQQSGAWRRGAWLVMIAGGLLVIAIVLAWSGARRTANEARQLASVGELQLAAREIGALSSLAANGEQSVLTRLRDRSAYLESMLTVLISGGEHKDEAFAAADGTLQARLQAFAAEWAEFKRRSDTLLSVAASAEAQTAKGAGQARAAEKRPPTAAAQKAVTARAGRAAEPGISASLLASANTLAGTLDDIRVELDSRARTPWLLYLAVVCVLGAMIALVAFATSVWRSGQALQQAAEQSSAQLLEALRPALRTLHIHADAAWTDPQALGRRLSDEVLTVIDGVKTLVKALDAAAAEADKFAVVGHVAAQALAAAEQKAADTGSSVQATARRISAIYAAVGAGAAEVQNQCARVLELVGTGSPAVKHAVRATDRLRESMESLVRSYAHTIAMQSEIAQGLLEVADLLTQAEGFALRGTDRLAGAGSEAAAFANGVRGYLGPSVAMLKQTTELVRGVEREADDFSNALAQLAAAAGDAARTGLDGTSALDGVGIAVQELSAKIASMSRIASGSDASQLLSALDEIVRQTVQSSTSARQVLDATQNAASHIEELSKLLNTMKPS